ncbi:NCS2 family permease [Crassaminicella profunda]|uniref:NCS2 family permease n=1 Tax=Crassaminicella profunda TaxID=1286698 RepID=UPI001CA6B31C|nr:NCS2 family permease [Crassaminicella profunda]QZY56067.1 NCS2 family permease [Crassaminicella profunda]
MAEIVEQELKQGKLERIFKLKERHTDIRTEVTAGLTTFMTMAYILIVQPSFMKAAGMDVGAVTVVTALLSGIFTLFMAFYTNLPFALAPAMGSNAFFAFTLVAGGLVTWQQGLGMVFISGIIFLLLTFLGLREVIVKLIPKNIKLAIGAAVGFFVVLIGFKSAKFMLITDGSIKMGNLADPTTKLALIGLAIAVTLMANKVKGALLWAMIGTTIIGIPMGITKVPSSLMSLPPSIAPIAFKLDVLGALKWSFFPLMFTFFVGDFFSTLGTLLGVSAKAGLLDEEGNLPNIDKPFLVDAIATVVGALFGSTVVTTYIESAAGAEEGGRTGLTGVATGICFLLTLFFTPIAGMIPGAATAPALILIGLLMLSGMKDIDFSEFTEAFPAFATVIFTAYTSSISNGISIGIISYAFVKLVSGKAKELHVGIYILCIPLIFYFMIM